MSKPTLSDSEWATDATFDSGPAAGSDTKTDPGSGIKAQGWRPGDALGYVGAWFNWWMNQAYLWFSYLNNLHNETDFLSQDYPWTGAHSFASTVEALGGVNVADTYNLVFEGAGEINFVTPRTRVRVFEFRGYGSNKGNLAAGAGGFVGVNLYTPSGDPGGAKWVEPLDLPVDAVLTGWRVIATNDNSGGVNLRAKLYKRTPNFGTPAGGSETQIGSTQTASGSSTQLLQESGLSETRADDTPLYLVFENTATGPSANTTHVLAAYELTYDLPGVRT